MKQHGKIVIWILFIVVSCTPPVVFDQPYPINSKDLKTIPDLYQGAFICESDSALLFIEEEHIYVRQEHYFQLSIEDVEERKECRIEGSEMYVEGRNECIPVEFVNDSLVRGVIQEYDTLFSLHQTSVARMYKGHVVLSAELIDGQWAVSFLSLQDNLDILYRAITDKTKIKNIGKVTALENITTKEDKTERYKIKPTMKEFDDLFNDEKIFIECDYLKRVHLNVMPAGPVRIDDK